MVRPPAAEVAKLMQVAREIRDTAEAEGYTVSVALRQNTAFSRTRRSGSSMERDMVLEAARCGASKASLPFEDVLGGLNIVATSDTTIRRYRVRSVKLSVKGEYDVVCNGDSSLMTLLASEPESFYSEEKWIFGFIMSEDHTADHLMAAEIVGWRGDGPFHLLFGTIIDLSDDQPPPGFTSTNEGLDDFDEDEGDGDGETGSAGGV